MDVMKPIPSEEIPSGEDWLYEVKYDGFRCVIHFEKKGSIRLISKNKHDLTSNFPEIASFFNKTYEKWSDHLPLTLDGELVMLNHPYQANFAWIQKRGRMKSNTSIQKAAVHRPATFIAFDALMVKGKSLHDLPLTGRKKQLDNLAQVNGGSDLVQFIQSYTDAKELWRIAFQYKAEGIIAKRKKSKYIAGKGHREWFKIKNWRKLNGFLTTYNENNGYYTVATFHNERIREMGTCKHGLDKSTMDTLKEIFIKNGEKHGSTYSLPPAICAQIHTLDLYDGELREPNFAQLLPNERVADCTYEKAMFDLSMIPDNLEIQKRTKLFWPDANRTKGDLIVYMREISPYMLPFLENKALTVIRFPDGVDGPHFFQKHLPDYAPNYIDAFMDGEERKMICNRLESLIWFASHGAIEFHVPFQKINQTYPSEIVFDLDPPSREKFELAVLASKLLKQILDDLDLISFVKTSGNKGIQVHIPIEEGSMSYDETGIFTQAIAYTIEQAYPTHFTTERLKKKRIGRLYIDYVQHGMDKTIIAPYSPRRTKEATVATPLFWEEVNEQLDPTAFTISNVVERVQYNGCPFRKYHEVQKKQQLDKVLKFISN